MTMTRTADIVAKLWALCNDLRDDGVTYQQYVTELTYLLFLKMAAETGEEEKLLPKGYRWHDLEKRKGVEQYDFYRELLIRLGGKAPSRQVRVVYGNASTSIRHPRVLTKLVTDLDALDWFDARTEGLGDLYEGLLEKNSTESKRGAGQYFTPRPLIDSMIALVKPQAGEVVQDPALGTAGFLVATHRYICETTNDLYDLSTEQQNTQLRHAYVGMELVPDTHRLAVMNALLHGFTGDLRLGNTLTSDGAALPSADVVLTNPPFGTKTGGGTDREDFTYRTSNKQFAYVQHIYRTLRPGGRAAVVLPDNVLYDAQARPIRTDLLDKCNVHTILRLPEGLFYAQSVKANVLFLCRGQGDTGNTQETWIYDLRSGVSSFGRRNVLTRAFFADFEREFGDDPYGKSPRTDHGPRGRFRQFTREDIARQDDSLYFPWSVSNGSDEDAKDTDPISVIEGMTKSLQQAMNDLEMLRVIVDGEVR
ncbi:type I restriction enzyme M protein [Actinokineospora globicatena]|uniref:class I SAM-dependent DNA methyltransferase n=2 Tax=Actinokineospora globicatena TaxID=103729 RepID=UPI0032DA6B34|nr:type I restriction enzyme M protein [Actinokineospora globicatena]